MVAAVKKDSKQKTNQNTRIMKKRSESRKHRARRSPPIDAQSPGWL